MTIEYAQENQIPIVHYTQNEDCNGYTDHVNLAEEILNYEQ